MNSIIKKHVLSLGLLTISYSSFLYSSEENTIIADIIRFKLYYDIEACTNYAQKKDTPCLKVTMYIKRTAMTPESIPLPLLLDENNKIKENLTLLDRNFNCGGIQTDWLPTLIDDFNDFNNVYIKHTQKELIELDILKKNEHNVLERVSGPYKLPTQNTSYCGTAPANVPSNNIPIHGTTIKKSNSSLLNKYSLSFIATLGFISLIIWLYRLKK